MKRQLLSPDTANHRGGYEQSQKRCRMSRPDDDISHRQPFSTESITVENQPPQEPSHEHQRQGVFYARTQSIQDWACEVASMSDRASQNQRRAHKASVRARSASPTKKAPEYRQISMARAHLYIDHVFDPPTHIDTLRSHIVGDAYNNAAELQGIPVELKEPVREIAHNYLNACRGLSDDVSGEAEWKNALLNVFRALIKLLAKHKLMTSASDKPWRTELKPRPRLLRDLLSLATPRLSAGAFTNLNITRREPPTEPSATATETSETTGLSTTEDSDPSNPLMTPKPDIVLGLARRSFTEVHQLLLGELQDDGQLLSDPQLMQLGLQFPFLLVEAKGLTTGGNMMAAENQAAVGGACAINILRRLHDMDSGFSLPPFVFSITTEGPLHQLFIHYYTEDNYQMTVHRAWRVNLQRDCNEFVLALARIVQWGQGEYWDAIVASMARMVNCLQDGVVLGT